MTCETGGDPPFADCVKASAEPQTVKTENCLITDDVSPADVHPDGRLSDELLPAEEDVEGGQGQENAEFHDDDGAVVLDPDVGTGVPHLRLPPGIPVPSEEMVRRHRAAGHTPYQPWCECCVRGAANAPAHRSRNQEPLMNIPELHSDYAFFKDKKVMREMQLQFW